MKLLRLCSYFAPEKTAASHLVDDLYHAYAKAEIQCICIAPTPSRGISEEVRREYKNKKEETLYDGYVTVKRFAMMKETRNPLSRAFRYCLCALKTYFRAVKEKEIDAVFVSSTPPTMGALGGLVAKKLSKKYGRKVPVIYNLQDIFPDSLITAGFTEKGSFIWKIGRKIENFTYKNADHIIVISEGFKRNLMEKGVEKSKITVISNWIDMDAVHPVPKAENTLYEEFGLNRDAFNVVYAGNFGEAQGAEVILDAAERLADETKIQFVIFGGGSHFEKAKERAKQMSNILIHELLPLDRVSEVYSLGDLALITCKPGAGGSAMPSKTWSIMACNTPILASFDQNSDLAEVLQDSGAGICTEPGNAEALAKEIQKQFASHPAHTVDLRSYVNMHAEKNHCLSQYIQTIKNQTRS